MAPSGNQDSNDSRTVGQIGLGLLGSAMAARLADQGFRVVGFDIDPTRCAEAARAGVSIAADAPTVVRAAPRVILCLPDSAAVDAVIAQILPVIAAGQTILDATTGDPESTRTAGDRLQTAGAAYVDVAVIGSSAAARRGDVTLAVGGSDEAVVSSEDLFAALAASWFHVGRYGDAARMKLVVNLVLGLNRAALAEALALADRMGLDPRQALDALRAGAAYSRAMDDKGDKMLRRDFEPQARLAQHHKDVRLILAAGQQAGALLPLSEVHERLLAALIDAGLGDRDNSAVIEAF